MQRGAPERRFERWTSMRNGQYAMTAKQAHGRTFLLVWGELDRETAPALDNELRQARAAGLPLTLDLSQVDFIDASGARVVAGLLESGVEDDGDLEIVPSESSQVRWVLGLLREP